MKKFIIKFISVLIAIFFAAKIYVFFIHSDITPAAVEYRTDTEPLVKRFGSEIPIETCCWKGGAIGRVNFGPTSVWLKGFIFADEDYIDYIFEESDLMPAEISFEKGIDPEITGFESFEWYTDGELSDEITGNDYWGNFYFDKINGVIYFDVESF
ncbi:MAG: hypothetical protein LUD81_08240 [Clostridiales bacterium]|nr:hypothetical protein [Clostridiales bacterium]